MAPTATRRGMQRQAPAISDIVRIGKGVLETLTSGMYTSPITIYREYIQNAADAIDMARAQGFLQPTERGKVAIEIDHTSRSICIRDNGSGVAPDAAASTLLSIGESPKRGTQARGFRGVGRLSALAYCGQLEFRTKALGATRVASVTWDCRSLRSILSENAAAIELSKLITDVATISFETVSDVRQHFFEVHVRDVARLRNDLLLNERLIAGYLAQVAPVPFDPEFTFSARILQRLSTSVGIPLDLVVADQSVHRPYRDEMLITSSDQRVVINDVEFVNFANTEGDVGAVGWIGHHQYTRSIPIASGMRGLRVRVGDVQLGEANVLDDLFREPRFNGWTVGELHVLDRRIVPNARRDNFEINHHYYNLLAQLTPFVARLAQRCRAASVSRNSERVLQNVIANVTMRLCPGRPLDSADRSRLRSSLLRGRARLSRISDTGVRASLAAELDSLLEALTSCQLTGGASVVAVDEAVALISKLVTNREQARRLVKELYLLCG